MRAGRERGVELVPEFGRLVTDVPMAVLVARGKIPLLGPAPLLVRADAEDHARVRLRVLLDLVRSGLVVQSEARPFAGHRFPEGFRLQSGTAGHAAQPAVGKRLLRVERLPVDPVDHRQLPLPRDPVAELDHFGNLVRGVDVDERERHVAEERLAREPEQDRAVLADRPQHAQVLELRVRLAKDEDALTLQLVEVVHNQAGTLPTIKRNWKPETRTTSGPPTHPVS